MGTKVKETCTVLSQECIGKDIYSMWIQTKTIAGNAKPGQFVSVYTQDGSKLLPRPISLCEIDKEKGALRLVYRVTGPKTGTESFSRLHAGAQLELLGPLGNGFPLEEAAGRKVFLMEADVIFACGPKPMLRAIKAYALEKGIPCWVSMEERMACGIGACLGCVCQSTETDAHSHVHNKRVCKDGPVFRSTEVEL